MSLNVVSLFSLAKRPRNWSNQELAEFYRVEASLARAGIAVETEQGLSDEGDPWFVFCRSETGDVIIHFARIDGLYVVASPAFGSCVRGRDFRALIEGLMEQHPVVVPRDKEKGKFSIHPAALLVALVTTAFFKLCQGDALAAEGDDHHQQGPAPLGGASLRAAASTQSHIITLDERAASTLMVAVAVAVAWEQATNLGETPLSTHAHPMPETSALLSQVEHRSAPIQSADLERARPETASASHEQPSSPSHELLMAPAPMKFAQAPVEEPASTTMKTGDEADARPVVDVPAVVNLADQSAPLPTHSPVEVPSEPQRHASAPEHPASTQVIQASAAMLEVRAIVGELLHSHLATNADAVEAQLLLNFVNSATFAMVPAADIQGTRQPVPALTEDLASGFSAVTAPALNTSAVEAAIHEFMAEHADFQIIKLEQEVIIYDPALTPDNVRFAEQTSFSFADGSSVMLIGLPHHAVASAVF